MSVHVLHRFHQGAYYCFATHLAIEQDILGMLVSISGDTLAEYKVELLLMDMQRQNVQRSVVYRSAGPEDMLATEMLLHYDAGEQRWVIVQRQGESYLALRTLFMPATGSATLSSLCLLDADEAAESPGMNAPLAIVPKEHALYSFLYPKPFDVHLTAPGIVKLDVALQQAAWNALEEQDVSSSEGADSALYQLAAPGNEELLLPENVSFDPFSSNAHITSAAQVKGAGVLAEAELSLIYNDQHIHLLVLCSPEPLVKAQLELASVSDSGGPQWRFWLTGWNEAWNTQQWTYAPETGVPFPLDPEGYRYAWPSAHVATVAGPPTPQGDRATVVVLLGMEHQESVRSHGVCLDQQGQVVQVCRSPLGVRASLCCCETLIVGVDLFEGSWRLWNWQVHAKSQLELIRPLDPSCQRAFVHAEPSTGRFWLIEELAGEVRVSHRDAVTLQEISPQTNIPDATLMPELEERPLNGYRDTGIVAYKAALNLLVWSPQDGLVLYQVE